MHLKQVFLYDIKVKQKSLKEEVEGIKFVVLILDLSNCTHFYLLNHITLANNKLKNKFKGVEKGESRKIIMNAYNYDSFL